MSHFRIFFAFNEPKLTDRLNIVQNNPQLQQQMQHQQQQMQLHQQRQAQAQRQAMMAQQYSGNMPGGMMPNGMNMTPVQAAQYANMRGTTMARPVNLPQHLQQAQAQAQQQAHQQQSLEQQHQVSRL